MNLSEKKGVEGYEVGPFYDEFFSEDGEPRPAARVLIEKLQSMSGEELAAKQKAAELSFLNMGITFTVASEGGTERIFPFDIIPRILEEREWRTLERGLKQRIYALNLFIDDIYHEQRILKDKVIPSEIVLSGKSYLPDCMGLNPPQGIWCHVTGTDLVRDKDGCVYVLEDNLRCPSGVSYVIENRRVMKRTFPEVFENGRVLPVDDYAAKLLEMLQCISPNQDRTCSIAVLTPGVYNSAYFEHSFLAQQMGVQLVEGSDLVVQDGFVLMRTTRGLKRVDVIYRRIDDTFLDPRVFRKDSMLGVPGLMDVYRAGRVALANAPGTGIADDKVVYKFVPDMIRYYLGEDAVIANVPTYLCCDERERAHVIENMEKLVVKSANEAGGYGMLIGPASTAAERAEFKKKILKNPRNFLAQPTLSLSRVPTMIDGRFEGRHVDLRPYILYGRDIFVMPGGLTRVALKKGSLVVNSSQGGGSKDTWVVTRRP
ncbi:MAG: circularly permuted type 2 ATP-grasp protein [Candidatus Omnitrophica bacterium]|nr:circularly permuted type 2 ATP-grasp protein [Candidatus Omnitrophota bacterium]